MATLHILYNTTSLPSIINQQEPIILLGDAVYILLQQVAFNCYPLKNDLIARGLNDRPNSISYAQLIELCLQHSQIITWT